MNRQFENIGEHGYMTPLTDEELIRDENGFTNPNLHRRIDAQMRESPEVRERSYHIKIEGLESIRTTEIFTHDEESTDDDIP